MNFILYIKCTDRQDFNYVNSFLDSLELKNTTADFLDIDNFSGTELVDAAYKALEKSDKCCVIVDVETNVALSGFYKIIYYVVENPSKSLVFLKGTHSNLEKILRSAPEIFHSNKSAQDIQNMIISFLK